MYFSIAFSYGWWDGSYPYRQAVNLSVVSGSTPTDYSVLLSLDSSNVGTGFDWNDACSSNRTNVRFIDNQDSMVLDYWVENCSSTLQYMDVWVKINDTIDTLGNYIYMYYGSLSSSYMQGDPSNVFEWYINFSSMIMESESSGSSQDITGNGDILENGRTFHTWGNSWKVFTGFGSFNVIGDGSQILELSLKAPDCGEIVATKFDTNGVQEANNGYQWCGSQTNWAPFGDGTYSGSGNWERVYSVLDDSAILATYIHFPIDDDADASGDAYYKDVRIRKYVSNEPTYVLENQEVVGTVVSYMSPLNNTIFGVNSVDFTCEGLTTNGSSLINMTLYGNWSGGWHANETLSLSGDSDSVTFTKNLPGPYENYSWNCFVEGSGGTSDWGENRSIIIDNIAPTIYATSPFGVMADVTPMINVTFDEMVSRAWYELDGGSDITICNNCSSSFDTYLIGTEGDYDITIYANDTVGNMNSVSYSFSIDMDGHYYDSFNDNSSVYDFGKAYWNGTNISYAGAQVQRYNGIEIGFDETNMVFSANQWGGSGNAGEVDITCPGGDASCYFTKQDGTNLSGFNIINGVATDDSDSSTVGFIMYSATDVHTRFSPSPHNQNGDNFVAVCYNLGQWFYDDNNGCDNPFTPVSTDVLVANLTWGITSVSAISGASLGGTSSLFSHYINTTENISVIKNVTWSEINTDSNNYINISLSVDGGINWYDVINGMGVDNISEGKSLVYNVTFTTDGTKVIGLDHLDIKWSSVYPPRVNFEDPTPVNGANLTSGNVDINVSVKSYTNVSTFIDFENSLVGYWNFEDSIGTTIFDRSSFSQNAILNFDSHVSNTSMIRGNYSVLDGNKDYISIGDFAQYEGMNELTISMWVNPSFFPSKPTFGIIKENSYRFEFAPSTGETFFKVGTSNNAMGGTGTSVSAGFLGTGNWYHLVGVYNGTRLNVFLDGVLVGTTSSDISGSIISDNKPLEIGSNAAGATQEFNGGIDEVMVFNRAISEDEVKALAGQKTLFTNIDGITNGNYSYYGCSIDSFGSMGCTENRSLTINSTIIVLPQEYNVSYDKTVININNDMYLVELLVENKNDKDVNITLMDFVPTGFTYGSFGYMYTWNDTFNGYYNGTVLGWNLTLGANSATYISYSLGGSGNYRLGRDYMIGLE